MLSEELLSCRYDLCLVLYVSSSRLNMCTLCRVTDYLADKGVTAHKERRNLFQIACRSIL